MSNQFQPGIQCDTERSFKNFGGDTDVSLFRKSMENDMESAFSEVFNIHIDG